MTKFSLILAREKNQLLFPGSGGEGAKNKRKQDVVCQLPFLAFLFGPVVTAGRRFRCF